MRHLKYGGSTMARTINCSAWHKLAEQNPIESPDSPAAIRGSAMHDAAELALLRDVFPEPGDKAINYDYTFNENDLLQLHKALDMANAVMDDFNIDNVITEEFVQLAPDIGGSADVLGFGDDVFMVLDWKFGHSPVKADKSWQGATYLLSAGSTQHLQASYDGRRKVFVIVQPAVASKASAYTFTDDELTQMAKEIITAARYPEDEPCPGEHCTFCPASAYCPAKRMQAAAGSQIASLDIEALDLTKALELADILEPWIKDVRKFAKEILEQGGHIDGWKMVQGRMGNRKWFDDDEAMARAKAMRRLKQSEWANMSMKTAPQLEKICTAKGIDFELEFSDLVGRKEGPPTMVPESDKRAALHALPTQGEAQAALAKLNK